MSQNSEENLCEEKTFAKIYKQFSKDLHNFLYYKYGADYSPQDRVQEAFIKMWDRCEEISIAKAKGFLFTVANNATLNAIKHQKVVLHHQKLPVKSYTSENPEFLLEEKQYLSKFKHALEQLTPEKREAFMLNRVDGKKHQEIADLLNVPRKTIEKRIYSALKELRKTIKEL